MKGATNELASTISSMNIGSEEICIWLLWEEDVDARYSVVELVDLAWNREVHMGLDLNEKSMEGNDVDDRPTPIVKLPQTCENVHYQFLIWSILWRLQLQM